MRGLGTGIQGQLAQFYTEEEKYIQFVELKGVFSKLSGDCIVVPNFLFIELETSNFGYLLIF